MKEPTISIPCDCGGALVPARLAEFDFSPLVTRGLKVTLRNSPGYRCEKCGEQTIDSFVVEPVLAELAARMATSRARLSLPELKYLRKFLGLTQEELAERLDINRVTVADWERGDRPISHDHEMRLRRAAVTGSTFTPEFEARTKGLRKAIAAGTFTAEVAAHLERALEVIEEARVLFEIAQDPKWLKASEAPARRAMVVDMGKLAG